MGLLWLHADAYGLHDIHASLIHPNATMFGFQGSEAILNFKRDLLRSDTLNYEILSIHQVDAENRAIVVDFQCWIPGKEGRGTDVMKFSNDWRVIEVEAIRHSSAPPIVWSTPMPPES